MKIKSKQVSDLSTTINNSISSTVINSLSDVVITTPIADQALTYNGTNWVNSTVTASITKPTIFTTTSNAFVPSALSASVAEAIYRLTPTANATVTLTNISAIGNSGIKLTFKKNSSFLVQIIPKTGETIDGFSGGTDMLQTYSSLTIVSDGSNWLII